MKDLKTDLLRAAVDNAPDAFLIVDLWGRIVAVNRPAEAMFGYSAAELIGRPVDMLVPTRLRDAHHGHRKGYTKDPLARPMGIGLELFALRKDGTEVPVDISLSPIPMDGVAFVMAVVRDITERRKAEAEFRKAEEQRFASMGRMASFVAHQLNTPLTNLSLLAAAIRRTSTDPAVLKYCDKIDEQRKISSRIVHDLMHFSRASNINLSDTDLRELVDAAVEQIRASVRAEVSLVREVPDQPVVARVDVVQMKEVFVNLLKNAAEATDRGNVTVHVSVNNRIEVSVRDTGAGIPPEHLGRLFEPFFTTKAQGDGTGLGLAFVKGVVTAHGGTVVVVSTPGEGSTFTVSLPRPG